MDDTFFIEAQEIVGPDCAAMHFYASKPFDSVEAVKSFAEDMIEHNPHIFWEEPMKIYKCHNNRLYLILTKRIFSEDWQPFEYVSP